MYLVEVYTVEILHNRLVTQTLLKDIGKYCLYCKEKDTQVHALLYCPSTIQLWSNVEKWVRKDIQRHYKMCDWDKVFGKPKSSFIINAVILTAKVLYMNKQTGKEIHVNFRLINSKSHLNTEKQISI